MKAKIFNFKCWVKETDNNFLKTKLDILVRKSGYNILNKIEHEFKPQGYTCLWLLAESHLAVHSFPEEKCSYIELSGCSEDKNSCFKRNIGSYFSLIRKK